MHYNAALLRSHNANIIFGHKFYFYFYFENVLLVTISAYIHEYANYLNFTNSNFEM